MLRAVIIFLFFIVNFYACKEQSSTTELATQDEVVINSYAAAQIDSTLESFVSNGNIAGASALIFEKGKEVYYNDFGFAKKEEGEAFNRETIVQIFSMTKPITGVALMTLYEEGAFELDDAVSKYAPEFANMEVFVEVDKNGKVVTEPVKREMTIRDLTRHTAGFVNDTGMKGLGPMLKAADPMNRENTLEEMAEKLGSLPLLFHPGAQWEYGPCVDVQAFLIERISGVPYKEYVRAKVLDPLGMDETRYYIPEEDRSRFSAMYNRSEDGVLTQRMDEAAYSDYTEEWPLVRGGSGLTSTVDDYMKFAQMLVNKGTYKGTQILKPETVELMATNHLSEAIEKRSWLPSKGQVGFGIDFAVRLKPPVSDEENMGEVGEFFWDGAASTLFWVDPKNALTAVLFVQLRPYDQIGLHHAFRKAVYSGE